MEGASLSIPDNHGSTALHLATENGIVFYCHLLNNKTKVRKPFHLFRQR